MPGLLRGVARTAVVAGTATAVSNRVSRRQRGRWAEKDQQAEAQQHNVQQQPPATPAPGGGMDDRIAQLKALGDLRSQGVLNEAEFEAQKRLILGR
jgi:Short C-terminal domain